jgi:hypothetical protein
MYVLGGFWFCPEGAVRIGSRHCLSWVYKRPSRVNRSNGKAAPQAVIGAIEFKTPLSPPKRPARSVL